LTGCLSWRNLITTVGIAIEEASTRGNEKDHVQKAIEEATKALIQVYPNQVSLSLLAQVLQPLATVHFSLAEN
jgi:hypothetical protein